jgi:hypothetical protein
MGMKIRELLKEFQELLELRLTSFLNKSKRSEEAIRNRSIMSIINLICSWNKSRSSLIKDNKKRKLASHRC